MNSPYADRPMWLYSRSSDKHLKVLFRQMQNLLDEANRREYTVAGTSQDMGSGKSMARMGLKQMMRAVKGGLAQAVLVQDLTRLSHDPAILMKILEFLQDHNAVLITTESDLQYELYIKGLEKHFLRRAAQKGLRLPWCTYHGSRFYSGTSGRKGDQGNSILCAVFHAEKADGAGKNHSRTLSASQCCYCRKVRSL